MNLESWLENIYIYTLKIFSFIPLWKWRKIDSTHLNQTWGKYKWYVGSQNTFFNAPNIWLQHVIFSCSLSRKNCWAVSDSIVDLVCANGDKDESSNSWFNFPWVLKRKTGWTTWQITQWFLENGIKVSCRRDILCLDLPVPLMTDNQRHPCEPMKLVFSFHINKNIS